MVTLGPWVKDKGVPHSTASSLTFQQQWRESWTDPRLAVWPAQPTCAKAQGAEAALDSR